MKTDAQPSIAVFRALQLGDLMCSVPAFRALRQAYPRGRIALIGLPNAASFVKRFDAYLDTLLPFPGVPGFPEQEPCPDAWPDFLADVRARHFDMAIQLHGSGKTSNEVVAGLGVADWRGFVPKQDAVVRGRLMPWPETLPEPLRYTALMRFMGIPVGSEDLEFPLEEQDRAAAEQLAMALDFRPERTVLIHPGARLASRRWPVDRYIEVGRGLEADGWRVAVTGTADEAPLAAALHAGLSEHAVNLAERTSLGTLAALISRSPLLICNDTGVSHIASALRTSSVVIASGSDVHRWAPLDRARNSVLWHDIACRPCAHRTCPIGHPCALGVTVRHVIDAAKAKLGVALTGAAVVRRQGTYDRWSA